MSKRTRKRPSKPYLGKGYKRLGKVCDALGITRMYPLRMEDPCMEDWGPARIFKFSYDFDDVIVCAPRRCGRTQLLNNLANKLTKELYEATVEN